MQMTFPHTFKTLSRIVFAGSLLLWLGACSRQEEAHLDHNENATTTSEPVAGAIETTTAKTEPDAAYPLDVCVVSGEELGSMGEPVIHVHEGVTLKLCCEHCLPKVKKDPAKYIAKVTKAPANIGNQLPPSR